MCTAISCHFGDHYFGRNLDMECSYGEEIVITPRGYQFSYRCVKSPQASYAMVGMALVQENIPLYFDAMNECGLCMAGLNFPGNAVYLAKIPGMDNIAPFELIPWVLSQCKTLAEVRSLSGSLNLADISFSAELPNSPLHFMVSDQTGSLVIEPMQKGICVYENPVGVLTNNPPFPFHLQNLNLYMGLSAATPQNCFSKRLDLKADSRGMGAIGLPGDLSSASRFVRAAFCKENSVLADEREETAVSQFFHILGAVYQLSGCNLVADRSYEYTRYSSCCNTEKGIYYYTTYRNSHITKIDLFRENLNTSCLIRYPKIETGAFYEQN